MERKRQAFPEHKVKTYLKDLAKELHKPVKHKYPTRKVLVGHKDQTWSMDLADMNTWKEENDGYTYILMIIDVFTRWAAARPLKNKSGATVLAAIKDVIRESGRQPQLMWVDEGKEFLNKEIKSWRKDNNIELYHTYGRGKSVIVERLNRTIKTMMWRTLTAENSHYWVDLLPKLITQYNDTKHSTIKTTPNEASQHPELAAKVWMKMRSEQKPKGEPKFALKDVVRISRVKGTFEKGYDVNWSRQTFTIEKIDNTRSPTVYHIAEYASGEPISGSFYNEELQRVKNPNVFLIDHVIKEKGRGNKKQLFVRWLGYGPENDSWILASDTAAV
jgi:transposase InsO family protein